MDFGATISRAINIVTRNRALWVLGFLAALAGGGGGGTNFNFRAPSGSFGSGTGSPGTPGTVPPEMQRFFDMLQQNSGAIIAGALGLFCVIFLISLALWVVSIIAEGGLIGGVDQVEREGATTFAQSWRMGSAKFWPLLGLGILLAIPTIILVVLIVLLVGGSMIPLIAAAAQGANDDNMAAGALSASFGALCIGGGLGCVAGLYGLVAQAIQTFGSRAIVLDNLGVMDSLRKGWEVFRSNLGNIILLAILMLVISFVVGLIVGVVSAALFLPVVFTGIASGASDPNGFNIGAGTIVLAAVAFIAVAIIAAVIGALFKAFNSTAWTLAYRQFTGRSMTIAPTSAPPAPLPR